MECKYFYAVFLFCFFLELIDTLWNVNEEVPDILAKLDEELIDTLWNVNYVFSDATLFGAGELIDTLWNVNAGSYKRLLPDKL